MEFNHVNFLPWVGDNYAQGVGNAQLKLLVLGESHYCDRRANGTCFQCSKENLQPDCISQTIDTVSDFVNDYAGHGYQQTYLSFERALAGKVIDQKEREELWGKLVFYNYVQYAQAGTRQFDYTGGLYDSAEAFREVLEEYMPDRIIVWGDRLYKILPDWGGSGSELFTEENVFGPRPMWIYEVKGKKIPALCVYHPSSPNGKAWKVWHQYYKNFLNL